MKMMSWILIFCLSSNLFASTAGEDLTRVVTEAKYALTVEWDQKDEKRLEAILGTLKSQLKELRAKGLSHEDILAYAEKNGNAAEVNRIKAQILLRQGLLDEESLASFVRNEIISLGAKGASWNSGADTFFIIGTAALLGILIVIAIALNKEADEWNGKTCLVAQKVQKCGYEDVCASYSTPYEYSDLQTCERWIEEYSCWQVDECVEWAK